MVTTASSSSGYVRVCVPGTPQVTPQPPPYRRPLPTNNRPTKVLPSPTTPVIAKTPAHTSPLRRRYRQPLTAATRQRQQQKKRFHPQQQHPVSRFRARRTLCRTRHEPLEASNPHNSTASAAKSIDRHSRPARPAPGAEGRVRQERGKHPRQHPDAGEHRERGGAGLLGLHEHGDVRQSLRAFSRPAREENEKRGEKRPGKETSIDQSHAGKRWGGVG